MIRPCLLVTLLCLFPAALVQAAPVGRIAAVVNDEVVTVYQLERAVAERLATPEQELTAGPALRREVLDSLIDERLIGQRAAELGLAVSDEELETAILDVQKQNKITRAQLEEALRQQGLPFAEYRTTLRQQILRYKLLGRELPALSEVTSREVRDYYQSHGDDYRLPPLLHLSRISFPVPTQATEEERAAIRTAAESARGRITAGSDFLVVLAELSSAGQAEGGDFGTVAEPEINPAFADAVKSLQSGEISPVVEVGGALHLLRLEERTPGHIVPLEEVKGKIEATLSEAKKAEVMKTWLADLRAKAHIDIRP
ncbi:MAG: hypothetical protein A2091_08340 [Desulfuromonadales bacterium GWD2_61_12]|nr:MAG: hypothetical protein A2005_08560 [Desulfuromonadales bacterium GWC2_61_20]OGR33705.1 MAG: hypothetical protein A2091_08340 [Desulfuromonadales bacterium GWD2_61_12]HAD04080.1 hypothetical protein [Desulfuromonas sp.]HBT83727.1 hypothetical protein [Desulfuromonas sp.]